MPTSEHRSPSLFAILPTPPSAVLEGAQQQPRHALSRCRATSAAASGPPETACLLCQVVCSMQCIKRPPANRPMAIPDSPLTSFPLSARAPATQCCTRTSLIHSPTRSWPDGRCGRISSRQSSLGNSTQPNAGNQVEKCKLGILSFSVIQSTSQPDSLVALGRNNLGAHSTAALSQLNPYSAPFLTLVLTKSPLSKTAATHSFLLGNCTKCQSWCALYAIGALVFLSSSSCTWHRLNSWEMPRYSS